MDFLPPEIRTYVEKHTGVESELLEALNRETNQKVMMPRMISGRFQGRVLSMLGHMIQPKCILEIGTYTGYSAICMLESLSAEGKIITLDINEELESIIRRYLALADPDGRIDFRLGNAIKIIPQLDEVFDMVFIDADKQNYSNYFNLVFEKVRPGGFIIADNVLWSGKVTQATLKTDKETQAIIEFNRLVHEDHRVENVLFPIRDGLMVLRKKE